LNTQSRTYYSSVYQAFLDIEEGNHHEKVRYVEKNLKVLSNLEINEYFKMLHSYHNSLFELGKHRKQLKIADQILEMCIMHHIQNVHGEDPYTQTLFKKAAAYYNVGEIDRATHVIKELLKIQPENEPSKMFLISCFTKRHKKGVLPFRSVSIGAILASAVVIAFELLYIRPHAPAHTEYVEIFRNFLFILGVLSLVAGEVWIRYKAVDQALDLIKRYKKRKQIKENT